MIALALLIILAQPAQGRRAVRQDVTFAEGVTRSRSGLELGAVDGREEAPLFSFAVPAPGYKGYAASYAGLPATDGCYAAASVTGTKGEALTFTRATTRFCPTSANEATGVMCASGEVCITSSGSTRGISVFRAGTNKALRSQEFDNASWTKNGSGVAAPTVTANAGVAPDGTTTADRIEFAACAADTNSSTIIQDVGGGSANHSTSIWLKANAGTPSISLCRYSTGANCVQFALTSSWRRYTLESWAHHAGNNYIVFGCENRVALYSGNTNTGAADVLAWGAQVEQSPYVTPYVATTSASATRNREDATFPVASATPRCVGATWLSSALFHANRNRPLGSLKGDTGTNFYEAYTASASTTSSLTCNWAADGVGYTSASSNTVAAGALKRWVCEYDDTNLTAVLDGTVTNTARSFTPWALASTYYVGNYHTEGGYHADGLLSNIIIDTSATRCR